MIQRACTQRKRAELAVQPQGPRELDQLLQRYGGTPLDMESVSEYEQWALLFFHDRQFVANPSLSITLQLDITQGDRVYRQHHAGAPGASLTAFLTWRLLAALQENPVFNLRRLEGRWYCFENLPLFFPVAVGGSCRFQDVLLEDVATADWTAFCRRYHRALEEARSAPHRRSVSELTWSVATFVGNLPYLNFTSLVLQESRSWTGRPCFYFGQRTIAQDCVTVPLATTIDHANADPYVLNQLLQDYDRLLAVAPPNAC